MCQSVFVSSDGFEELVGEMFNSDSGVLEVCITSWEKKKLIASGNQFGNGLCLFNGGTTVRRERSTTHSEGR